MNDNMTPDELRARARNDNVRAVCAALRVLGVASVRMAYQGSGDSGCFEAGILYGPRAEDEPLVELHIQKSLAAPITFTSWSPTQGFSETTRLLGNAAEELMMLAVEDYFGGWENNDGGEGEITLTVDDELLEIDHGSYYTEVVRSSARFGPHLGLENKPPAGGEE